MNAEDNKCRLCGSPMVVKLYQSNNTHGRHMVNSTEVFDVFHCHQCKVFFLPKKIINDEYYEKYYAPGYYNQSIKEGSFTTRLLNWMGEFSIKRKQKMIESAVSILDREIDILDIGCGSGDFLQKVDTSKFNKFGVEINKEGAALCQSKGIETYTADLDKIDFHGKKFDVVTLWHVLEHLDNPENIFNGIKNILSENGLLLFQTPNTNSVGCQFGKKNWFHLDSPRHLFLFNKESVSFLCQKTGYQICGIKNEFYDYPLDLFWSLRKSKMKYIVYPFYPLWKYFSKENLTFVCKKID